DSYVEFRPGTDLALANGVLHLLVASGKVQRAFVDENCVFKRGVEDLERIGYGCFGEQANGYTFSDEPKDASFDDFVAFLAGYAPAKVAEITGVSEAQIGALA